MPGFLAFLLVNPRQEIMLEKQLIYSVALFGVTVQAALHEVAEFIRPSVWDVWHVNVDNVVNELASASHIGERGLASC